MSNGVRVPPRAGSAVARAMMMNEDQMMTVMTAAAMPIVRGEKPLEESLVEECMALIIGAGHGGHAPIVEFQRIARRACFPA
ncbi:hypothetical protein H4F31_24885 [Escherichia coli]|nr:hypothetical protein [Escherichia coli]